MAITTPKLSANLLNESQRIMDLYYQDFNSNDDFFRLQDFAWILGTTYGKVADEVAQGIYQNSRAETGMGQITFSQDWWASKEYAVTEADNQWEVCLDIKYVGFTYDTQNSGIQIIQPTKGDCKKLIRTTLTELWILDTFTPTKVSYWYLMDNKIVFAKNKPNAVRVFYIPTEDDENFKVPSSVEFYIANRAWTAMETYRNGLQIKDTTNDLNANTTQQSETDLSTMKPVNT